MALRRSFLRFPKRNKYSIFDSESAQAIRRRAGDGEDAGMPKLDVVTIGRSSVDLYGAQIGGRLEDMASFHKYIGGSPTNIAAGTARLGLKSGLITRVGDEHMGRFIRETLAAEGVDVARRRHRPRAADRARHPRHPRPGALPADLLPRELRRHGALRGRHRRGADRRHPRRRRHRHPPQPPAHRGRGAEGAAPRPRSNGARTALDIDYRPNLWGLAGHEAGEERFIESAEVTAKLQSTLHLFDLIVGTEEEFHIAGGSTDTIAALRAVRAVSAATLVCKRGADGRRRLHRRRSPTASTTASAAPASRSRSSTCSAPATASCPGLLKGWLTDQDWPTALKYANACGAFAVSRHGCTPAYPSWEELQFFLDRGIKVKALRNDAELEQLHWSTNRLGDWPEMRVFAFDHRMQLEKVADELGVARDRIGPFKLLCLEAAQQVAAGRPGYGLLCDGRLGRDALYAAAGTGLWIGRPVEDPGTRPLRLEIEPDYG